MAIDRSDAAVDEATFEHELTGAQDANWLDRPLLPGVKLSRWALLYAILFVFIILTRLVGLAGRGYSHDESIHAWESWKLLTGQGYVHSPVYHGPFLYHFTALIYALFGHNEFTARLSPALFGIALTMLPLLLRCWLGKKGTLAAIALMAISPVMMHRSRFLRHDPYVTVFNLLLFIAILRYLDRPRDRDLYLAAGALALGFTAKETTFITYFIFGTFLALVFLLRLSDEGFRSDGEGRDWRTWPSFHLLMMMGTLILPLASPFAIKLLGGDPASYTSDAVLFSGAVFLGVTIVAVGIGLLWDRRRWPVCAGIFMAIFVPLFTTMFTNGQGLATGFVGQLGYWLSQQGVARGDQPWYYYLVLMPLYEFLPLLLGLGSVGYVLRRSISRREEDRPQRLLFLYFLIYWGLLAFLMYSWAGEKMPWLTMHLALPLQLLAGWGLGKLLQGNWSKIREAGGLWLLILVPMFLYALSQLLGREPFVGTERAQLSETMAWVAALVSALVVGAFVGRIMGRMNKAGAWRTLALSIVLVLALLTVRFAWMASFINADLATEFLVYAQGTPDVAVVAHELEDLSYRLTGGLHLKVAYDDEVSWPFAWYLRDYDQSELFTDKPATPVEADVVLVGPGNEAAVKPLLGSRYYRRQYRLIWWPNQSWYMDMTPATLWADLKDPAAREKLWNVVFYRKYEASLTDWPFVSRFAMYVRRDIAQQLWDFGPEAAVQPSSLPGDEYVDKWEQRSAASIWGSSGTGPGQLQAPKGLAVDAEGNLYVADSQNHRIQVFNHEGRLLRSWGELGPASDQLKEPWGIAVSADGEVYVTDTWNHRVQVFDRYGQLLRGWGIFGEVADPGNPNQILYGPRDLVLDAEGNLYVADTGNKRIVKYDPQGNPLGVIGMAGEGEGQFQEPVGLALDVEGNLYVADTWNQRIQVFDAQGNYLRQWSVLAWEGASVLNKPYLACSDTDLLYVSDPEGYRVLVFDTDGSLEAVFGQYGTEASAMDLPTGLALDDRGRLIVSDSGNDRLLVFDALPLGGE